MSWLTDNTEYKKADEDLKKALNSNVKIHISPYYYIFLTFVYVVFIKLSGEIDKGSACLGYIFGLIVSFISVHIYAANWRNNLAQAMFNYRKVRDKIFNMKEDWYERNCTCCRAPWEEYKERWR